MIRIANAQLWVNDQDEALAFYTEKLGWEIRADVTLPEMGDFRWLPVGPAGQEDFSVVLMAIPGAPVFEKETSEQLRAVVAKGVAAPIFLTTDDCHASYDELRARGVEFVDTPEGAPTATAPPSPDPRANPTRLPQGTEGA